MTGNLMKRESAIRKELLAVEKQERKLRAAADRGKGLPWKEELEKRIPEKVYSGLESAFRKGFSLVFEQGRGIIEKSCRKEELQADHSIRDFAVQVKGGRKELRSLGKSARKGDLRNLAITTAEGIGLGALGVGMPDVVLFLTTLLKGIYESALHFGYTYDSGLDRLLILHMIRTAMSRGEDWAAGDAAVDALLTVGDLAVTEEEVQQLLRSTASVLAMDMLILKFIQGIPVVGILGGAANPLYYSKILKYVQLKYRKGYLLKQLRALQHSG